MERQVAYKTAVPFVHVPIELLEEWNGHNRLLEQPWFRDLFTDPQLRSIEIVDAYVETFRSKHRTSGIPDVYAIFKVKEWQELMATAAALLSELDDLLPR